MTATFSHRGNDDYELLKFNDFQEPLPSNSKNCRTYSVFYDFQVLGKWPFQGISRTCGHWPPCTSL